MFFRVSQLNVYEKQDWFMLFNQVYTLDIGIVPEF